MPDIIDRYQIEPDQPDYINQLSHNKLLLHRCATCAVLPVADKEGIFTLNFGLQRETEYPFTNKRYFNSDALPMYDTGIGSVQDPTVPISRARGLVTDRESGEATAEEQN